MSKKEIENKINIITSNIKSLKKERELLEIDYNKKQDEVKKLNEETDEIRDQIDNLYITISDMEDDIECLTEESEIYNFVGKVLMEDNYDPIILPLKVDDSNLEVEAIVFEKSFDNKYICDYSRYNLYELKKFEIADRKIVDKKLYKLRKILDNLSLKENRKEKLNNLNKKI